MHAAWSAGAILLLASLASCFQDDIQPLLLVQMNSAKMIKPESKESKESRDETRAQRWASISHTKLQDVIGSISGGGNSSAEESKGPMKLQDVIGGIKHAVGNVVQTAEQAGNDYAKKILANAPGTDDTSNLGSDVIAQDDTSNLGGDIKEEVITLKNHQGNHKKAVRRKAKQLEEESLAFTAEVLSNDNAKSKKNTTGKYFNFDWEDNMTHMLDVLKEKGRSHTLEVSQCRDGEVIWQGDVRVHHKVAGASKGSASGRRDKGSEEGQWRVHDVVTVTGVCPQAVTYSLLGNGACSQDEQLSGSRRIGDWVYGGSKVSAEEACNKHKKCKGYHWNKWDQAYVLVHYIDDALGADTEKGELCYTKPRTMFEHEAPSYTFMGNGSCYDDEVLYEKRIGEWVYDKSMADAAKACNKMGACRGVHWNVQDGAYVLVTEVGQSLGADTKKGERCYAKPSDLVDYDYEAEFMGQVLSVDHSKGAAGEYFNFDWHSNMSSQLKVRQCRGGEEIWYGKVRMFQEVDGGSSGDSHGRREKHHAADQWQTDDTITTLSCSEAKMRQALIRARAESFEPAKAIGAVVDCDTAAPSPVPTPVPTTSPTPAPTSVPTLAPTVPCETECADGEGVCTIADDPHIMVFDKRQISLLQVGRSTRVSKKLRLLKKLKKLQQLKKQVALFQAQKGDVEGSAVQMLGPESEGEDAEDEDDLDDDDQDLVAVRNADDQDLVAGEAAKVETQTTLKTMITSLVGNHGGVDVYLVKNKQVTIQARFLKTGKKKEERELFVQAIAISGSFMGNNTLIIGPVKDKVTWNGKEILQKQVSNFTSDGVTLKRSKSAHLIEDLQKTVAGIDAALPLGVGLTVNRQDYYVNVALRMGQLAGGQDGLCGNFNGDGDDDSLEMIEERDPRVPATDSLFQEEIPGPQADAEVVAKKVKHSGSHKHTKHHRSLIQYAKKHHK